MKLRPTRQRRWTLLPSPGPEVQAELRHYPPLLAALLHNRGITTAAAAQSFLKVEWSDRYDPFLMRDMERAVERVGQALASGEQMAVYGDFDTDGVTGVTLLTQMLAAFGGKVRPYIPRREGEGYGLNIPAVERLYAEGVRLLITVDCGISNVAEIARASAIGLDVVVFDHHHVPPELPQAHAVVNPKRTDCDYPFKNLCGVGIAFKFFEALHRRYPQYRNRLRARELLDVVALGTIADMMPLRDENRVLVSYGLQAINETQRPGLLALMEVAGLKQGAITSTNVAFGLAPRINAAGRLEDAIDAYDLLLAPEMEQARQRAHLINETNSERRTLMLETQDLARDLVRSSGRDSQKIIVVAQEGFHHGIVGLVAGRLAEEFYRPVLVMGTEGEFARGSARSIPGFNIVEALGECRDLFVKYGGHAAAAGFTIANANVAELERRLQAIGAQVLSEEMLVPELKIDAEARLSDLNEDLVALMGQLAPFGQENSEPLLATRGLRIVDVRTVGAENRHLKLRVSQNGGRPMDAIGFGLGHWYAELLARPLIDLAYHFEADEWKGNRRLQLRVRDLRISE